MMQFAMPDVAMRLLGCCRDVRCRADDAIRYARCCYGVASGCCRDVRCRADDANRYARCCYGVARMLSRREVQGR